MAAMLQQFDKAAGIFEEVFIYIVSRVHTYTSLSVRNLLMSMYIEDTSSLPRSHIDSLTVSLSI